jgi:hypothetical protein
MDMDARTVTDTAQQGITAGSPRAVAAPGEGASRPAATAPKGQRKARIWWLKQLHSWHWVSAAVSLVGMLLFAITGLTLNHAATISAEPRVTHGAATLPAPLLARLAATPGEGAPLPDAVAAHIRGAVALDARGKPAEWSPEEVYVALPGPGRDAWISIDRASGAVTSELTDRGWISYFNDLHKGRNSGTAWFWFIDLFAVASIIFTLTGLLLLQLHARHRPSTWPLAGLGLVIPLVIAVLFIH